MSETVAGPETSSWVRDYVGRVREALADLPFEDVDDLTGGLEADLVERAAELPPGSDLVAAFGAPRGYAAELRAAAGLPPALPGAPTPRPSLARRCETWLRERRRDRTARWPWVADLAPVWWVLRGLVLGGFVTVTVLEGYPVAARFVAMVAGGAWSFWWGRRGERAIGSGCNRAVLIVNALALLFLLPVASAMAPGGSGYATSSDAQPAPFSPSGEGVWVEGEAATSLYAYDAQGNRIDRVRLFDQSGRAVTIGLQAWEFLDPSVQPPRTADGSFDVNGSVFPIVWGTRTGWESSSAGWEPPVQISSLRSAPEQSGAASPEAVPGGSPPTPDVAPTGAPTPTATPTDASAPTPTRSGSLSVAPAPTR